MQVLGLGLSWFQWLYHRRTDRKLDLVLQRFAPLLVSGCNPDLKKLLDKLKSIWK